jgi:hypothetical protein
MTEVARVSACSIGFSRCRAQRRLKPPLQTKVRATLILLFAMLASAAPLDLSAWKYRKKIPLTPGDGLAVVNLDREVYMGAGFDLSDIRVVRDGTEVPFYWWAFDRKIDERDIKGEKLFDLSVVDGPAVQFTIRVGDILHNFVRIYTTQHNFRQRVRIEASEDNRDWATLRDDGAIFDFTQDSRQFRALDVTYYPGSAKPYVRVTIFGWNKISYVQAASVYYEMDRTEVREALATINPRVAEDSKTQSTIATLDLGVEGLPVDRIVFETTSPQFHRAVSVESSANGRDWSYLAQGIIARMPRTVFKEESLGVSTPETRQRYLRIQIYNRDDQPIQLGQIRLEGIVRKVMFLVPDAGDYWLYYGNPKVHVPSYDLEILLAPRPHVSDASWTLGPAERNPIYHPAPLPQKPWSEQHPAILYTVLGGAVLALGIATFRFASRLRPNSS